MLDIERPWLRPVLSANPVGMLFGAAPLASMGDRFGRCFAIAVCAVEEVGDGSNSVTIGKRIGKRSLVRDSLAGACCRPAN